MHPYLRALYAAKRLYSVFLAFNYDTAPDLSSCHSVDKYGIADDGVERNSGHCGHS